MNAPDSSTLRRLGLGRLVYHGFHRPWSQLRGAWRDGGPWARRRTEAQRAAMEAAAAHLPPLPPAAGPALTLHLLTGARFWYQTAFCLYSLARYAGRPLAPVVYDDGTLAPPHLEPLRALFPLLTVRRAPELEAALEARLPARRFPFLRDRWRHYPNIRKLIDPHLGSTGWKLVIDSDLLFFRRPDVLLDWLAAPDRPLHAVDCAESYGYSRTLLAELAGAPLPPLVNVGLCGLRSEDLDWEELEHWCATLITRERTHYYLEQALVAMLAARRPCAVAPAADYVTRPGRAEALQPRAVMHHYVADAKRWYFRHTWRHVLPAPA